LSFLDVLGGVLARRGRITLDIDPERDVTNRDVHAFRVDVEEIGKGLREVQLTVAVPAFVPFQIYARAEMPELFKGRGEQAEYFLYHPDTRKSGTGPELTFLPWDYDSELLRVNPSLSAELAETRVRYEEEVKKLFGRVPEGFKHRGDYLIGTWTAQVRVDEKGVAQSALLLRGSSVLPDFMWYINR
jgi:hypothetical protein